MKFNLRQLVIFIIFIMIPLSLFQNCGSFEVTNLASPSLDSLTLSSYELHSTSGDQRCRDIQYDYQSGDQRNTNAFHFAVSEQERIQKLQRASLDQSLILKDGDLEPSGTIPNLDYSQDATCPAEAPRSATCRTFHVGEGAGLSGSYQMDDGIRIRHILAAIESYKKTHPNHWVQVKFAKNSDYFLRLNPFSIWTLSVRDMSNFVFDGNGSNFWISSQAQFLQLRSCTNCTVKNLHAEHFDRSHTQGTVIGATQSGGDHYLKVQIDDRFPLPPEDPLYSYCGDGVSAGSKGRLIRKFAHVAFFKGSRIDIEPGSGSYLFFNGAQSLNRSQRIATVRIPNSKNTHVSSDALKKRISEVVSGKRRVAFSLPQSSHALREAIRFQAKKAMNVKTFIAESEAGFANYSMMFIIGSANVKVQNVGIHSTIKMAVKPFDNKGLIHFDKLELTPRGTSLLAGTSDGIHGANNRGATIVENSIFKNLMDDGIHLKTSGLRVSVKHSDREFTISQGNPQRMEWEVRAGDRLQMIDNATGADLGEYSVTSVTPVLSDTSLKFRVTLNKNLVLPSGCSVSNIHYCAHFFNINNAHPGSVVRENLFENKLRHALITHGGTKITGNWMEHLQGGVLISASHIGPEGPVGSSFGISGNVMLDITGVPLNSFVQSSAGTKNPKIQTGLEAHCNILETVGSSVLSLRDVAGRMSRNLYLKSNKITQPSFPSTVANVGETMTGDPAVEDPWCQSQFPSIINLAKYKNRSAFKALGLNSPSAPPEVEEDEQTPAPEVLVGLFRTPNGGIYHGFKDFYCKYGNMERVRNVWGSQWDKVVQHVPAVPTGMVDEGYCGALQGVHKQGSHLFYTFQEGYTCWINTTGKMSAWAGLNATLISYLPNKNMAALGLNAQTKEWAACQ